jgi:hypothetical protein
VKVSSVIQNTHFAKHTFYKAPLQGAFTRRVPGRGVVLDQPKLAQIGVVTPCNYR